MLIIFFISFAEVFIFRFSPLLFSSFAADAFRFCHYAVFAAVISRFLIMLIFLLMLFLRFMLPCCHFRRLFSR